MAACGWPGRDRDHGAQYSSEIYKRCYRGSRVGVAAKAQAGRTGIPGLHVPSWPGCPSWNPHTRLTRSRGQVRGGGDPPAAGERYPRGDPRLGTRTLTKETIRSRAPHWWSLILFPATARAPHCFRTLAQRSKQVPALGTHGEASGPSEFKKAYASDESRRRLLWEREVPSSSLGAPTSRSEGRQPAPGPAEQRRGR